MVAMVTSLTLGYFEINPHFLFAVWQDQLINTLCQPVFTVVLFVAHTSIKKFGKLISAFQGPLYLVIINM